MRSSTPWPCLCCDAVGGNAKRLFGAIAAIGRGGSDKEWYYGCKLLVAVTPTGVVTGFVVAPANTEERWVADALLGWRADPHAAPLHVADLPSPRRPNGRPYVGPTGPRWPPQGAGAPGRGEYLADKGFWGRWWQQHWHADYGAALTTPKDYPGPAAAPARRQHRRRCQIVETINGHLIRSFGLHFPGVRSPRGLLTRLAAKLAAVNLGPLPQPPLRPARAGLRHALRRLTLPIRITRPRRGNRSHPLPGGVPRERRGGLSSTQRFLHGW